MSDARPSASIAEFSAETLNGFLDRTFGTAPLSLERVGGQSNPTFFVTHGAQRMVLRKKPACDRRAYSRA